MTTESDDHALDHLLDRRMFLGVAGAGLATLLPQQAEAQRAEQAGLVEDVRGEAFAEAGTARRLLDRAAALFIGDQVGTGPASRATLRLGQATTLRLGERARLTIDKFLVDAGGEITLQSGPMLFDRPAGAPPAPMQIRGSFGLIAVRGTQFWGGPSNGVFGVFVVRGEVVVSGAGQQVTLRNLQGTDIVRPGAPPTPARPWPPARVRAALASVG